MIKMNIGEYCLIAAAYRKPKLRFSWEGPYVIVDIENEWVYKVKDLISRKEMDVHISRIYPYNEGLRLTDQQLREQSAYLAKGFQIQKIVSVKEVTGKFLFEVEWFGFSPEYNSDEPAEIIYQDAADTVKEFINKAKKTDLIKKLIRFLGIKEGEC